GVEIADDNINNDQQLITLSPPPFSNSDKMDDSPSLLPEDEAAESSQMLKKKQHVHRVLGAEKRTANLSLCFSNSLFFFIPKSDHK
ncbi:hypothetical protein Csa_023916, partial [Cucumis sativus]